MILIQRSGGGLARERTVGQWHICMFSLADESGRSLVSRNFWGASFLSVSGSRRPLGTACRQESRMGSETHVAARLGVTDGGYGKRLSVAAAITRMENA